MEALTRKQKENNRTALLTVVGLIVAITLLSWSTRGGNPPPLQVNETNFRICADDGTAYLIDYGEVTDVSYEENMEFGTCIEGTDSHSVRSGCWRNADWGEYFLCADKSVNTCVVITTERAIFAFNCESDGTTRNICETLKRWIDQKKQVPGYLHSYE